MLGLLNRTCAGCISSLQEKHSDLTGLPEKACFQMNDTHPTIAGAFPPLLLPARCLLPRLRGCLQPACQASRACKRLLIPAFTLLLCPGPRP